VCYVAAVNAQHEQRVVCYVAVVNAQHEQRVVCYVAVVKKQHAATYSDIYIWTRILLTLLTKYVSTPCGWPLEG
jgi:hypothetical protein